MALITASTHYLVMSATPCRIFVGWRADACHSADFSADIARMDGIGRMHDARAFHAVDIRPACRDGYAKARKDSRKSEG